MDSSSSASSPNDNKLKFLQEIKFEVNKTCGDKISYFDVTTTLPKSNLFLISSKSLLLIIKGNYGLVLIYSLVYVEAFKKYYM